MFSHYKQRQGSDAVFRRHSAICLTFVDEGSMEMSVARREAMRHSLASAVDIDHTDLD